MVRNQKRPLTMGEWIDVATRGLCDYAKDRIGIEVHGHFAEAFDEVRGKGTSEAEATRAAVMSLGDPVEARRQFKRTHLTWAESVMLGFLTDRRYGRFPVSCVLKLAAYVVGFVGFFVYAVRGESPKAGVLLGVMALVLALCWCLDAFEKLLRKRFGEVAGVPTLFWAIPLTFPVIDTGVLSLLANGTLALVIILPFVSLWRKAGRVKAGSDR